MYFPAVVENYECSMGTKLLTYTCKPLPSGADQYYYYVTKKTILQIECSNGIGQDQQLPVGFKCTCVGRYMYMYMYMYMHMHMHIWHTKILLHHIIIMPMQ